MTAHLRQQLTLSINTTRTGEEQQIPMTTAPSTFDYDPRPSNAQAVKTLDAHNWAVIDLDSGTVLSTNIVLVPFPTDDEEWCDALTSSDSDAIAYGEQHGIGLYRLDD